VLSSLILTVVACRLLVLPFIIDAADISGRMNVVKPAMAPIQARIQEARLMGDQQASMVAVKEMRELYKSSGIKFYKVFLPAVFQMPLGYGMFRLSRGMANLPAPGMESGGLSWFSDLTMSDPYFLLPAATSALIYITIKVTWPSPIFLSEGQNSRT